jgi:hypothetical protein
VNLKIDVQRVGLNLCKNCLGAAYWARVLWTETHVLSLRTNADSVRLEDA